MKSETKEMAKRALWLLKNNRPAVVASLKRNAPTTYKGLIDTLKQCLAEHGKRAI